MAADALIAAAGLAVAQPREAVIVHAAGSLRAAMTDLAKAFESAQGTPVKLNFGASGLFKERLPAGETSQIFASTNLQRPQALLAVGVALQLEPFARNALCALASPAFTLRGQSLS